MLNLFVDHFNSFSTERRRKIMPSKYENLLFEIDIPLARVTLNRPERRNALSLALMSEPC
jgi:1,4-dihydroxy-2-naphthoyl-CoA synthase